MDLWAYSNIPNLSELAAKNGITVPRLRGLRLMSDEERVNVNDLLEEEEMQTFMDWCRSRCGSMGRCAEWSKRTDRLIKKYSADDGKIRWSVIHGKKRKVLKYMLKRQKKKVAVQFSTWNKYCGADNVLYIHARIGGGNWESYRSDVEGQPWFIEKVDDAFDSTYCDIYARIKPE